MLTFILKRVGLVIPTFIGVTLLTFALIRLVPGDPSSSWSASAVSIRPGMPP